MAILSVSTERLGKLSTTRSIRAVRCAATDCHPFALDLPENISRGNTSFYVRRASVTPRFFPRYLSLKVARSFRSFQPYLGGEGGGRGGRSSGENESEVYRKLRKNERYDRTNGSSIIAVGQHSRSIFVKQPLSMTVLSRTPVYLPREHVPANPRDTVNSHVFGAN